MPYATEPFGDALRQARIRKGWSQRDLAIKSGLPQPHVSRIETGVVDPKLSTFLDLARLLDLEPVLVPRGSLNPVWALLREAEGQYVDPERPVYSVED